MMIVAEYYDGDDIEVAWKQHDVYGNALSIIVSTCNKHVNHARVLLQTSIQPEWGNIEDYDHRTLQYSHDLLAMVWRSQNDFRQVDLLSDAKKNLDDVHRLWLDWLKSEIESWYRYPHLVHSVQTILANQNERIGDIAERKLSLSIICKFPQAPWRHDEIELLKMDLTKLSEE